MDDQHAMQSQYGPPPEPRMRITFDEGPLPVALKASSQLKQSEAKFQESVCELLDWLGIVYTVSDASRAFNRNGDVRRSKVRRSWPDITGCLPAGRLLVIECKTLTGKFQAGQRDMLERLKRAGAVVIVARTLEDVALGLRDAGYKHQIIGKLLIASHGERVKPEG